MRKINKSIPVVAYLLYALVSFTIGGCARRPILQSDCLKQINTPPLPRLKGLYDSGSFRVLAVSGDFSWDHKHDVGRQEKSLTDSFGPIANSLNPNLVVGLGATSYFAVAAFAWHDKDLVRLLMEDYSRQPGPSCCCRRCALLQRSRNQRRDELYEKLEVTLAHESAAGRVLLIELVDSISGTAYLLDLTHACSSHDTNKCEECLRAILESSTDICHSRRKSINTTSLSSGAISTDVFYSTINTLAELVQKDQDGRRPNIAFRLINISTPPLSNCCHSKLCGALDLAMRSIAQQSKDNVVASMTALAARAE
jgi:hypothetical protein